MQERGLLIVDHQTIVAQRLQRHTKSTLLLEKENEGKEKSRKTTFLYLHGFAGRWVFGGLHNTKNQDLTQLCLLFARNQQVLLIGDVDH